MRIYRVRMLGRKGRKPAILHAIVAVVESLNKAKEYEIAEKLAFTIPTPLEAGLDSKTPRQAAFGPGINTCRILKNEEVSGITESRVIRWII